MRLVLATLLPICVAVALVLWTDMAGHFLQKIKDKGLEALNKVEGGRQQQQQQPAYYGYAPPPSQHPTQPQAPMMGGPAQGGAGKIHVG